MERLLFENEDYQISYEYECAFLNFRKRLKAPVTVGWFYGDPVCAIISKDGKYLVVAGHGLIVYKLTKPFHDMDDDKYDKQCKWKFEEPVESWEVEHLVRRKKMVTLNILD